MEISYLVYDNRGAIQKSGSCPLDHIDMQAQTGYTAMEGEARDDIHYVDLTDPDNPAIADKVSVPHTVTGNVITLPGDDLHCEVTGPITDSFDIPATETDLTYTADVPGQYTLTLSGVKYLPTEVQVAV